jgi:gluconokinase
MSMVPSFLPSAPISNSVLAAAKGYVFLFLVDFENAQQPTLCIRNTITISALCGAGRTSSSKAVALIQFQQLLILGANVVLIVMGVAGSGKTSVSGALARELGWDFADADSFHSPANLAKMKDGIPLDDGDRAPWLHSLRRELARCLEVKRNLILACSALKQRYREQLMLTGDVKLIYLKCSPAVLRERLLQRRDHFMPASLLESQLDALEEPQDAITVNADLDLDHVLSEIRARLSLS